MPPPDISGKRFAVTGASGFIGKGLVQAIVNAGGEAIAVIRDNAQSDYFRDTGVSVRIADVTDPDSLSNAFSNTDGVFHLAALFNDPEKSWDDYHAVNVQGTLNVLSAAKKAQCKRVVHCSTVGVATEAHAPPYSEETPYSPQPEDKYEVTKTEAEIAARKYARENDLSLAVIRPAQVYGPGDRSKAKFYKLVKKGVIVNPGDTMKHLIYIDDLCEAMVRAIVDDKADNEVFLIAGEKPVPLRKLVALAAAKLQVPKPRIRLPATPVVFACTLTEHLCNLLRIKPFLFRRSMDFFVKSVECDTSKARSVLGFESKTSVEEGVSNTVDWLQRENLV